MSNICYNTFILKSENKLAFENVVNNLKDSGFDIEFYDISENEKDSYFELSGAFSSSWAYPALSFKNLIVGDVYFRCISEEFGNGYYACNIYSNGNWKPEQFFELYE